MAGTTVVCPNCGSTDVGYDRTSTVSMLSLGGSRRCNDCGYSGIFPEVDADRVEEHREQLEEVDVEVQGRERRERSRGRMAIGAILLLLGIGATSSTTWGTGLLAGMLAIAVGAAVLFEEIAPR